MLFKIKLQVQKANTATTRILNTTAVCSAYIHPPALSSVSIEKTNRTPQNTAKLIVVQNTKLIVAAAAAAAAAARCTVVLVLN